MSSSLEDVTELMREDLVNFLHNFREFVLNQEVRNEAHCMEIDGVRHSMRLEHEELLEIVSDEELYADRLIDTLLPYIDEYIHAKIEEANDE